MKRILLVLSLLSLSLQADLNRSSKGVVTDTRTKLAWQDNYSDNGGAIKQATWTGAIDYCENLSLEGGGWRLPNINELYSLVDRTRRDPAIDANVFTKTTSRYDYLSSTTYPKDTDTIWGVSFKRGQTDHYNEKTDSYHHIRCVRTVE